MRISDWSSDVCSSDLIFTPALALAASALAFSTPASAQLLGGSGGLGGGLGGSLGGTLGSTLGNPTGPIGGTLGSAGDITGSGRGEDREHTSELQSLMRISYAVFCLKKKKTQESTTQVH